MDEQTNRPSPESGSPSLPRGTETVLVVDDDPGIRATVRRHLRRLGYQVMEASGPESALRLTRMSGIDLVVMDVILPMMSGLTLSRALHAIRPGARILFMSGYTNEEVLREVSAENPGVDFVPKPFTAELLSTRIRRLLDEPREPDSLVDSTPRGDETVLVVDDDDDLRRSVVRMLERLGYRVLQAQDPDHALRIALQSQQVALIVMDVVLPRLNGVSLAGTISSLRPKTRVLYMSGYEREELRDEYGLEGAGAGFLEKPFTPDELGRKVRAMIDGVTPPATPRQAEGP